MQIAKKSHLRHATRSLMMMLVGAFAGGSCTRSVPEPPSRAQAIQLDKIAEFQGEYRFLSNFYPAEIRFEGITYPSVEHAYQSAKTLDMSERRRIAALETPAAAKRAGRALALRADWEQVKFEVMQRCVHYKFTHHPELRDKLLETGDAYLEEGNTWGDQIWGVSNGVGENRLGKILMKIRQELRNQRSSGKFHPD